MPQLDELLREIAARRRETHLRQVPSEPQLWSVPDDQIHSTGIELARGPAGAARPDRLMGGRRTDARALAQKRLMLTMLRPHDRLNGPSRGPSGHSSSVHPLVDA